MRSGPPWRLLASAPLSQGEAIQLARAAEIEARNSNTVETVDAALHAILGRVLSRGVVGASR